MYKKLNLQEIKNINSPFFKNIKKLYTDNHYIGLKDFLKDLFRYGKSIYFFENSYPVFKICEEKNGYTFRDESDKTEIFLDDKEVNEINRLLKDDKKINTINKNKKTILEELVIDFNEGGYKDILETPYIVYDIETIGDINNLKNLKFMLGYSVISNENHSQNTKYRLISMDNLQKFVDFLLEFNGFIVGYNNIFFDNPVCIHNVGYSTKEIDLLNNKSLDLFVFIRKLTGRRLGLNKVSQALIGIEKTLSNGLEGTQLLTKYNQTGDKALLNKVQNYCKNDVRMTLGVLLYFLKYKKIYIDGEEIEFDTNQIINLGKPQIKQKTSEKKITTKGFFDF